MLHTPQPPAIGADVTLDLRVFAFTLVIGLLTGAVFGLAPLLHLSSDATSIAPKEGGTRPRPRRGATGFPAGSWRRRSRS